MGKFFLLADDDRDDAELFSEALSAIHPVVDFYHVEDGNGVFLFLANLQKQRPDIIFLDLNMPEVSGWQCLARLKNNLEFKHIPVIMYSTSSNPRDKEIAIDLGASGFLTKPSDFKILVRLLQNIVHTDVTELNTVLRDIGRLGWNNA